MDLNVAANKSEFDPESISVSDKSTDKQPNWRDMFNFVENNTLPNIPGVDMSIVVDLFSSPNTGRKKSRRISPVPFYFNFKRKRRVV